MLFRRSIAALAAIVLSATAALAQGASFSAGTVWGNDTAATRPGKVSTVTSILDRALGSTRGSIIERGASGWAIVVPSATVGLAWVSAGTGADPVYGVVSLVGGGCNAALTASNGGILYSTASACSILAGTATARQMLQSGASAAPAWSTTTWPATTTINRILWSSAANVISDLATANSSILVTDSGGVPSLSTTLPAYTLGGTVSGGGNQINNVIIGTATPLAGSFTSLAYSTTLTGTSSNAAALAVGRQGATNPAFQVDASAGTSVTGVKITALAAGGNVGVSAISSATDENLAMNAKGAGTILIGNVSTGPVTVAPAFNGSSTINAVTGYRVNGAAATGNALRGNGTNFVSAALAPSDLSPAAVATVKVTTFTVSGTWTRATGMLYGTFECWGAGAGGGGASNSGGTTGFAAGGGGAGSYSRKTLSAALAGSSLTVTIGAAGGGGANTGATGTAGGDSCFTTSTCTSGQLVAGKGASGGTGATAIGANPGGLGGVAGTGDLTGVGQAGTAGNGSANTTTTGSFVSGGGTSSLGSAPQAFVGAAAAGVNASGVAAGGSGGSSFAAGGAQTGGNGAIGICIATEFVNQ